LLQEEMKMSKDAIDESVSAMWEPAAKVSALCEQDEPEKLAGRCCNQEREIPIPQALKVAPAGAGAYRLSVPAELSERMFGFDNERIVSEVNAMAEDIEWFFRAREGLIGPYPSRSFAQTMLIRFKARCQNRKNTGGR
jgi:hypothetical protein